MEKWADKVAVVTGATSGIGEETCRQLITKGMIVVGFGRKVDKLQVSPLFSKSVKHILQ